jgi:uncharacterized membrane protein YccF (DUF307 family)
MNMGLDEHRFAKGAGLLVAHITAIVAGAVMALMGLAMGVTMVLLPIGIPLGLIGVLLLVWGLWSWSTAG